MRQKNRGQSGKVLGLMPLEPEDLGGCETRQDGIADGLMGFLGPTQRGGDFGALRSCHGVAPQLGRADHPILRIERHESVLLAADTDGDDFRSLGLGRLEGGLNGPGSGPHPLGGVLLLGSGREPGQETVRGRALPQNAAGARVDNQCLGGLRAGIDADEERTLSHRKLPHREISPPRCRAPAVRSLQEGAQCRCSGDMKYSRPSGNRDWSGNPRSTLTDPERAWPSSERKPGKRKVGW